jgi:protein subunit release factor A
MTEIADAVHKAEAREAEEARVRLMETNRDKLVDLADKVEGRGAEEAESNLLIELGEEIEYSQDNVASIARMLKGNIHEEFKDESVEAARVGQRKLDAFRARLELLLLPTDNFQHL